MSGTTWAVLYDGEPLTWERMAALGDALPSDRWQAQLEACPAAFESAEWLSSREAQALLLWLRGWLPDAGRGHLRLVPSIPTAEVARMRPHAGGKPVRV